MGERTRVIALLLFALAVAPAVEAPAAPAGAPAAATPVAAVAEKPDPVVPGLSVELSAAPAVVAVGDPVTITVTYRWPAGWRVERTPDPAQDFRAAFVTDAPPAQQTTTAEGVRRVVRLTLAATRSGAWALPRPDLTAIPETSGSAVTVRAPAVIVQVGAEAEPPKLPPPAALRLRPPRPPAADQRWWWFAGAGAVLLAGGLWWALHRRAQVAVAVPPAELFGREVARLAQVEDPRELGAGLSLAIRRYMGAVWDFDAPGATVREIAARQRSIARHAERFADLARILQQLDDLRWAAGDLARAQVSPQLHTAREQVVQVEAERAALAAEEARGAKPTDGDATSAKAGAA